MFPMGKLRNYLLIENEHRINFFDFIKIDHLVRVYVYFYINTIPENFFEAIDKITEISYNKEDIIVKIVKTNLG